MRSFLFFSLLFSSLLFSLNPFDSALAGVLPDTGQTKCYNNSGEIPCPAPGEAFYGQDGNYQGPQPDYQLSADGLVVSDLNTGLMWQRADDVEDPGWPLRMWDEAVSYCSHLVLGGHSDWRLPSVQELVSIVDYGRYVPAINPAFSCLCRDHYYWSVNTYPPDIMTSGAYIVDCNYGVVFFGVKHDDFYVRCVRGGP